MIEENKEIFELGVSLIIFSFVYANAEKGELNDIAQGKEDLIEQFHEIMGRSE